MEPWSQLYQEAGQSQAGFRRFVYQIHKKILRDPGRGWVALRLEEPTESSWALGPETDSARLGWALGWAPVSGGRTPPSPQVGPPRSGRGGFLLSVQNVQVVAIYNPGWETDRELSPSRTGETLSQNWVSFSLS